MVVSHTIVKEWAFDVINVRAAPMKDWDKQVSSYMLHKKASPWAWPCLFRLKHISRKKNGTTVVKGSLRERILENVPAQGDNGFLMHFDENKLSSSDCLNPK